MDTLPDDMDEMLLGIGFGKEKSGLPLEERPAIGGGWEMLGF